MQRPLTPKEFKEEVSAIVSDRYSYDIVTRHMALDHAINKLLYSLGYIEAVEIITNTEKEYGNEF